MTWGNHYHDWFLMVCQPVLGYFIPSGFILANILIRRTRKKKKEINNDYNSYNGDKRSKLKYSNNTSFPSVENTTILYE